MDHIPPIELFQGDSWFDSVPTCKYMVKEVHSFKGIVMTYHFFAKDYLDKTTKDWSDGSHIFMYYLKYVIFLYDVGSLSLYISL